MHIQKWLKNGSFLLMCLLMTYVYFQTKETPVVDKEVVVTSYDGYRQVVYLDSDRLLIPVTYPVNQTASIEDDVKQVFLLLKDPGELKGSLQSVIPEDVTLLDVELDQGVLRLNFSSQIDQLKAQDELRFLEATSYVFCQLDGVDSICFARDGELLEKLPNGQITLSEPINSSLGINNFETTSDALHHTLPMTVFLSKTIGKEEFYVPVTKRVASEATLDERLNDILGEVSVSSTLQQASPLKSLEVLEGSTLEDGHLSVNLNAMILLDETTIDQEVYDLLLLSLSTMQGVDEISIQVQGQPIDTPEPQKVSDIIYNVVKI